VLEQELLDPLHIGGPTGIWNAPGPIPPNVRDFGFIPDLEKLKPGDLLLVSAISPSRISRAVMAFQKMGGYPADHARWHHAAVYLGGGYICEATAIRGVIRTPIYKYCSGKHLLRFRRAPMLQIEQRYEMAIRALTHLKNRYGHATLLKLAWSAILGFWNPNHVRSHPRTIICSELYAQAYSWVTKRVFENMDSGEMTPAFLSYAKELRDVKVPWLEIFPALGSKCSDNANLLDQRRLVQALESAPIKRSNQSGCAATSPSTVPPI